MTEPRPGVRRRAITGIGGVGAAALVVVLGVSAAAPPSAVGQRQERPERPDQPARPAPAPRDCAVGYDTASFLSSYGQYQQVLARTRGGKLPNGIATEPDFSRDSRSNRRVVFTSTATNIDGPVRSGTRNVYVVKRGGSIGALGNAWRVGRTVLVSRGRSGAANGDSWGGSLSGGTGLKDAPKGPRLLAFLSKATNLPGGNPSGTSAYVASANGGGVRRIAGVRGRATGVGISGDSNVVYVSTSSGLWMVRGGTAKRLVSGGGISSPSTTQDGRQAAYEKNGVVWTVTNTGAKRRIGAGEDPHADGGEPGKTNKGMIRAIGFTRSGGAWKAQLLPRRKVSRWGATQAPATVNGGGSTVAFGNGANACLKVEVLKSGQLGGYDVPQGGCPEGQGTVTGISPSTRYNYVAFTCSGGGLYHYWVGDKNNDRHAVG